MRYAVSVPVRALIVFISFHHHLAVEGFSPSDSPRWPGDGRHIRRAQWHTKILSSSTTDNQNNEETIKSCPFSKHFPRYRIDMATKEKNDKSPWLRNLPIFSDVQKSMDQNKLDQKFPGVLEWLELDSDDDNAGIAIFAKLWRSAARLSEATSTQRVVVGCLTQYLSIVRNWVAILDWMQNEKALLPFTTGNNNISIQATIHKEGQLLAVELCRQGGGHGDHGSPEISAAVTTYDPEILTKRTQAWVKRILVEQGICPFTKSVKKSGQGLGDLGIPVAKIQYASSTARRHQICSLMADTWEEIEYMLRMGPTGKDGISSILLAAPEYDDDFDLWSGPIFAMLESGVVACRLEKQVGVVCFHPLYATPDGSSFPGFGHMHSVRRLKKFLQENDPALQEKLTDDEIAAGGAWQRRTPHATINVLRAEQLEAAEGRRVTGELYTDNIRKLNDIGTNKLTEDLEMERTLR